MNMADQIPIFTEAQLRYLERTFKEERPRMSESRDEIFFREGKLEVVAHVRELVKRQMEKG